MTLIFWYLKLIIPRDTGHRVKDHIMKMIQNEVLDDKATKNIQSGIQTGSSRVGISLVSVNSYEA